MDGINSMNMFIFRKMRIYILNRITYDNTVIKEERTVTYDLKSLDFTSEVSIYKTTRTSSSSNNKSTKLSK